MSNNPVRLHDAKGIPIESTGGKLPVEATIGSSALPTGAATGEKQDTGNASLSVIENEIHLRDVGSPQRISQNSTSQSVPVPATARAFFVVSEGGTSRFEIDNPASATSTLVCFENGFLSYPITGGSQTLNTYGVNPSIANVRFLA